MHKRNLDASQKNTRLMRIGRAITCLPDVLDDSETVIVHTIMARLSFPESHDERGSPAMPKLRQISWTSTTVAEKILGLDRECTAANALNS